MKITSAPASAYMRERAMASSRPVTAVASERAMMTVSGLRRAASAARSLMTISSAGMTFLPSMCPQRFGNT